tara:strand:+ start:474 stop:767 length:294 start_codon:yes stop_codon:yes gene_type:complete
MYIKINSNTRITANEYAWIVEERMEHPETGNMGWVERKNYTSLESLMRNYVELLVRQKVKGSKSLITEMNKINDAFLNAVEKQKATINKIRKAYELK